MESKKIKTQVYALETVFHESAELPIDVDFTMPDYCPEISKILKCRAVSRISSKGVNGRNITVDGNVTMTLLYADEEHRLCAHEYIYPFNKTFEMSADADGGVLTCKTRCEYLNCRAVTGRKMDIHGAIGLTVFLRKRTCTEVLSDYDDPTVELLRGTVPATSPMGNAEKYLQMEEEIELGQGQPSLRSLLRYDAAVTLRESKLLHEKAVVKGELLLTVLYCGEDGGLQSVKSALPFSQILELVGIDELCSSDTKIELAGLELKPRQSASGEVRSLTLNAKLLICTEAYCDNDVAVISDAFAKRYETEIMKSDLRLRKLCMNLTESFHCKETFNFENGAVGSLADLWCEPQISYVGTDGKDITVKGTVQVNMVLYGTDGVPSCFEKKMDFEYRLPTEKETGGLSCEPTVEVRNTAYTITGENSIEIRTELGIHAGVYENKELRLISDLEVNEQKALVKKDCGAMTVYFASAGEKIWDIAGRYAAGVEEIMRLNQCADFLSEDKMILIPMD